MQGIYEEFGRLLRAARERSPVPITQQELANRVGLSRTSITNIELGKQHISLHMLFSLSEALGITPKDLLPDRRFAASEGSTLQRQINSLRISDANKQLLQTLSTSSNS